jgi:cation:H+ antiporter
MVHMTSAIWIFVDSLWLIVAPRRSFAGRCRSRAVLGFPSRCRADGHRLGTSSPELAVSVRAALNANSGVSLGNVLGSNIFNVGLILGVTALILPLRVKLQLIRFDIPILAVISLLVFGVLYDSQVSRTEGVLLLTTFVAYSAATFYFAKKDAPQEVVKEFADAQPRRFRSVSVELLCIGAGLAVLVYGADLLVDGAVAIARALGVSEAVIGLTVVAAGTSLPELVSSLVAAARKEPDVAVGTIVGSNIFNITCILGLSSTITPITQSGLGNLDLGALLLSAVILIPMAWTGFVLKRWEGAVLLVGYSAYVALLWP